jgi:nucleotide-binding universal stress UspA family protein
MTTLKQPKDLLDFTDKVVVVTGASSGIGAGIARRFAAAGANVVVHYNRSAEAAAGVASEIGIGFEQVHVRDQHPAIGILGAAEKEKPDLIVMASHGRRGLNKMLLGSVANEVVSGSTIPVLVVK